MLEAKLKDFNIKAEVVAVYPGPVITRFEIQPAPGTPSGAVFRPACLAVRDRNEITKPISSTRPI